jgi:nucleotide-binding universal stress UspA family protein
MKALIGVDGSSNSLAAVEFVGRWLSARNDQLILLYAAPEVSFGGEELLDAAVQQRARSALSRAVFDEALARLGAEWQSRVQPLEVAGSPGASLLAAADAQEVDLVVVGFRGTSFFERLVLGSVSRAVVHSANVPVLVVKSVPVKDDDRLEKPAGAGDKHLRLLVAYDGPEFGQRIAALLGQVEWPAITEGWVMTVVQPMFITELPEWLRHQTRDPDVAAMAGAWQKEHEQNVAAAQRELEAYRATLPPAFLKQTPIVAEGRPAEQLLAALNKRPFDLVVVGSRGRGNVAQLLVGSTTAEVLAAAPCSVLIVR